MWHWSFILVLFVSQPLFAELEWLDDYFLCLREQKAQTICFSEAQEFYAGSIQIIGNKNADMTKALSRSRELLHETRDAIQEIQNQYVKAKASQNPVATLCLQEKLANMLVGFSAAKVRLKALRTQLANKEMKDSLQFEYAFFNSLCRRIHTLSQEAERCQRMQGTQSQGNGLVATNDI